MFSDYTFQDLQESAARVGLEVQDGGYAKSEDRYQFYSKNRVVAGMEVFSADNFSDAWERLGILQAGYALGYHDAQRPIK